MENLPIEITRTIYEYDPTYRYVFNKVLVQLKCNFFIYNCNECCKKWNDCFCYCKTCKTYLKYCHQIYFDSNSTDEDDDNISQIIQLGFD